MMAIYNKTDVIKMLTKSENTSLAALQISSTHRRTHGEMN